uniref:Uncharacterized protein n=1 Tax=Prolemur simus TaxID=1328070 RepID=A0A8C8YJ39_PROSS
MGQGNGHSSNHLLPGSLHLWGEVLAKILCQDNHQNEGFNISWIYLKVFRIHVQPVTVQLTQVGKGALEIIHVLYSFSQGSQHLLAMGLDLRVAHDSRGRGQVAKVVKEPLGPWVDNQDIPSQGFSSSLFHIHLAPQACDNSFLFHCKMNHGVRIGISFCHAAHMSLPT